MVPLLLLVVVLAGAPSAQTLRLHEVVGPEAADAVTLPVATGPPARVGRMVLDVGPADLQSVGLEVEPSGTARLSVWLAGDAAAALADVTGAAAGGALAVVVDGRVLATPLVAGPVRNGLVAVEGLEAEAGRALAARLRGDLGRGAVAPVEAPPPIEAPAFEDAPPVAVRPSVTEPAAPRGPSAGAPEEAARAFVEAVRRRDWTRAADALHPDAWAALREPALGILRLEGRTVHVREGLEEGTVSLDRVLPGTRPARLDALADRDLAAVYLAALDALGVWGPPGAARAVIGRVEEGDRVHVLFGGGGAPGRADVTVVTVGRDGAGRWRALLTEARGF